MHDMQKVTIIRVDGNVIVDGESHPVDCSTLPAYVHAIQWSEIRKQGWIEFVNDGFGVFLPNVNIIDFTPYQYLIDLWTAYVPPPDPNKQAIQDDSSPRLEN
jgi:hypothetical protein